MTNLNTSCKSVVEKIEGGLACGVIDLITGMLLGIHNNASYNEALDDIVAAATMDMFRGSTIDKVERLVREHRGIQNTSPHGFEEIHVTSKDTFHFAKAIGDGKAVIMLITRNTTNIGMGWAQLKSVIPEIEPLLP